MSETFTPPRPLNTAVLFLVFNRPDTTARVFETIRQAKPPRLYVAADGPREGRNDEAGRVAKVREIVTAVDWPCEVNTLFRDKNLGCKYAVSEAITWFFEHEEQGIILEDDCLPSQSFFWFCEELLEKYINEIKIGQVCGFNPLVEYDFKDGTYGFSKFGPIWGWASWRRAWRFYDVHIENWPEVKGSNLIDSVSDSKVEKKWRIDLFDRIYNNEIDTWDYQWSYAKLMNNMVSVIPEKNIIKNIGFRQDATHTTGIIKDKLLNVFEHTKCDHPKNIVRDKHFDKRYLNEFANVNIYSSIKRCSKKMLKKYFKLFVGLLKRKKKWNVVIDKECLPVSFKNIDYQNKKKVNVSSKVVNAWLSHGGLQEFSSNFFHKKGIEFFFSSYLLDLNRDDILLDAAGGKSSYLDAVRKNIGLGGLYLTDQIYNGIHEQGDGIKVVGGDISNIDMISERLTKIACHHAFEHFQENKDIEFIHEAYRLLKPGGILVIVPLFLTNRYIECWNIISNTKFDDKSSLIVDKTASIPGADDDGHFARFYNNENLLDRILKPSMSMGFECEIVECEIDGSPIPDMSKNFGSIINCPTRALRMKK